MNRSDEAGPYAVWTDPETGFSIEYSLRVFHDIDFVVNEGFRRIPHGGIEHAGLLLGKFVMNGVQVDAFAPIECSHEFGPSFVLSVADIEQLRIQIRQVKAVGWFISHSRSPLVVTDREAELASALLPHGSITVLVKPEKFRATQFAFFHGNGNRDGTGRSIVLPLASRRSSSAAPAQSAPGPTVSEEAVARVFEPKTRPLETLPDQSQHWVAARKPSPSGTLWAITGAAVAFVFLAAYGFYRSGLPTEVPLNIIAHGSRLVVVWPAEQSRLATSARFRVNNGEARELATDEKNSGTVAINDENDSVDVELILSRWGDESHSIERYLRTAKTAVRSVSPPQASVPVVPGP